MAVVQELYPGKGFVEVADRVFVARYADFDVNVGLVVGGDGALVIDTRSSVAAGREVLDDIARVTAAPVTHVAYTHQHFDHTLGARAFAAAHVIAHEHVAAGLPAHARDTLAESTDDLAATNPSLPTSVIQGIIDAAGDVRLPDQTFSSLGFVDLGDRVVELAYPGRGHTDGDILINVPDAEVAFAGDLVEQAGPPGFGTDCYPLDWAASLDAVVGMTPVTSRIVPGHGHVVDREYVEAARSDIGAVAQGIADAFEASVDEPDVLAAAGEWPYPVDALRAAVARAYAHLIERGHPRAPGHQPPPGAATLPLV